MSLKVVRTFIAVDLYQISQKLGEFGVTRLRLWTSPIPRVCILNYKKICIRKFNFGRG